MLIECECLLQKYKVTRKWNPCESSSVVIFKIVCVNTTYYTMCMLHNGVMLKHQYYVHISRYDEHTINYDWINKPSFRGSHMWELSLMTISAQSASTFYYYCSRYYNITYSKLHLSFLFALNARAVWREAF